MFRFYIVPAFAIAFLSCTEKKVRVEESMSTSTEEEPVVAEESAIQYLAPINIKNGEWMIMPIGMDSYNGRSQKFSYSSHENYSVRPRFWNMIFVNKKTGENRILTTGKYNIQDYQANIYSGGPLLNESVLYKVSEVIEAKGQEEGLKNGPTHLFISKNDGSNFIQLSSNEANLISYSLIPETDLIIYQAQNASDRYPEDKPEILWYSISGLSSGYRFK